MIERTYRLGFDAATLGVRHNIRLRVRKLHVQGFIIVFGGIFIFFWL